MFYVAFLFLLFVFFGILILLPFLFLFLTASLLIVFCLSWSERMHGLLFVCVLHLSGVRLSCTVIKIYRKFVTRIAARVVSSLDNVYVSTAPAVAQGVALGLNRGSSRRGATLA